MARDLAGDRRFPYPYGSDLHWFWGWGDRIQAYFIDDQNEPGRQSWMIFRPDRLAVDAMMRFSVDYPALIQIVERYLADANDYFEKFVANPDKTRAGNFVEAVCNLRERIRLAVETIAAKQVVKADDKQTKPVVNWNRETGELRVGKITAKTIRNLRQAKSVVAILDAFQELEWPESMDDPLKRDANVDPTERLGDALKSLNRNLTGIKFRKNGTGEAIVWEILKPSPDAPPAVP